MIRRMSSSALLAAVFSLSSHAQTLEPLPVPLRLPPGLKQTLPLNPRASYYMDAARIADCPLDIDEPFGTCGNLLFGGYAIFASQLSGFVEMKFYPPRQTLVCTAGNCTLQNNVSHFEFSHPGNLTGRPNTMKAPQLFQFPLKQNAILDAFEYISQGDVNLDTGDVTNLRFNANFINDFYLALGAANPRLKAGAFQFPGAYGSTYARFDQRPDGLLDFSLHATTFLPLGSNIEGAPVRIPMPMCADNDCTSIEAPGTSLRPSIQYTTRMNDPSAEGSCGDKCADIPFNTVQMYQVNTYYSSFLDRFNIRIPELGGPATSRTHFQGRVEVQYGPKSGDIVPVFMTLLPPEAIIGEPDAAEVVLETYLPLSSNRAISIGLIGHNEILTFPSGIRYFPRNVGLASDPFDGARGALNLQTGKFVFDLLFPGFLTHNFILKVLEQNDGRIPLSSFLMRGPASIEKGPDNETVLRMDTRTFRNYEGYLFPTPDYNKANARIAGPGSYLDPALRIQAVQPSQRNDVTKRGNYQNVLAFIGDRFSIDYTVPCDAVSKNGTFTFTNTNSQTGGTFVMQNLVSVNCTNTRISTAAPGDYDAISFTGFGTWSRDPDEKDPHVATVHVFPSSPDGPYISVQIDGGIASNVHTKPPRETLP